jgi:tetratricopeptide (TPR) repeat protein
MPGVGAQIDKIPCADEIRAALEHMAASDAFRGSPQLVAFLRYVVEATLRGTGDRIKGYTIAVEALGRGDDFDPQADPIVRVEAMRLRRALNRYYENGGKHDPVLIDLPLGSYVPAFRRAASEPSAAVPHVEPESAPLLAAQDRARRPVLRSVAAGAALVLCGAAVYGALDFWFDFNTPRPIALQSAQARTGDYTRPTPYPVVYVGGLSADAQDAQAVADRLRAKVRDALARFDEIAVISGPAPKDELYGATPEGRAGRYALTGSVEATPEGVLSVAIRVADLSDDRIAFARTFHHHVRRDGDNRAEDAMVRDVAVALAQPYGVLYARERAAQMAASDAGDPRYRCLVDSYDYWRAYDVAQHARVRDCLERMTASDPTFAAGFAALAEIVLLEQRRGINRRRGDAPPIDRALQAARRAVELKPGSARAYQALMDVYFLRGDHALALEAGEKAVTLNPYNPNILACYGARLIALGEVEKGARLLREGAAHLVVRPPWMEFHLFVAAYFSDDWALAASHARQIPVARFPLGYLAQALIALHEGKTDVARQLIDQLGTVRPRWRADPRGELKHEYPAEAVTSRIMRDLAPARVSAIN